MTNAMTRLMVCLLCMLAWGCEGYFSDYPDAPDPGFATGDMGALPKQGDPCGPCARFIRRAGGACDYGEIEGLEEVDICGVIGFVDTDAQPGGTGSEQAPWSRWPDILPTDVRVVLVAGDTPLLSSLMLERPLHVRGGYVREAGTFVLAPSARTKLEVSCDTPVCVGVRIKAPVVFSGFDVTTLPGTSPSHIGVLVLGAQGVRLENLAIAAAPGLNGEAAKVSGGTAMPTEGEDASGDAAGKGGTSACAGPKGGDGGRGGLAGGGNRPAERGDSVGDARGGLKGLPGGEGGVGQKGDDASPLVRPTMLDAQGTWPRLAGAPGKPGLPGAPGAGGGGGDPGTSGEGGGGGGGGGAGCPGAGGGGGGSGGASFGLVLLNARATAKDIEARSQNGGDGLAGVQGAKGSEGGGGGSGGEPQGTGSRGGDGGVGGAGGQGGRGADGLGGPSVGVWCQGTTTFEIQGTSSFNHGMPGKDGDGQQRGAKGLATEGCGVTM